ncbi:hypothetical protein ACLPHZ_18165, partial [Alcaligenaceae bacterium Me47]
YKNHFLFLFYFFILKIAILFLYIKAAYKASVFIPGFTRPLSEKIALGSLRMIRKVHKKTAWPEQDGFLEKTP